MSKEYMLAFGQICSASRSAGHIMTMRDWCDAVTTGEINDTKGFGLYSNGTEMLVGRFVYPSLLARKKVDTVWSHIVWFEMG